MAKRRGCSTYIMCRGGALFQAVRDIMRGIPGWRLPELLRKNWPDATDQQLHEVIDLAHLGVIAGGLLSKSQRDKPLPPGVIPRLPK